MSTASSRQRRHSNARGPVRFRWQPKEPPVSIAWRFLMLILFVMVLSAIIICEGRRDYARMPVSKSYSNNLRGPQNAELKIFSKSQPIADVVVVGSGLAGLTATLTILDRGGKVVLIEKESTWGGNSNKASSGMNACCTDDNNDTLADFRQDTIQSAGDAADLELIDTLVANSANALTWFRERVGVDLSELAQLGGHSRKRTHRPKYGFVGAELISSMEAAIRDYEVTDRVAILVDTQVTEVLYYKGETIGVAAQSRGEASILQLRTDNVILATGGFASDRSPGSYLEQYRPELLGMAATAGSFSTGDGISLAESLGAATRDMEKIQIHPTGFVDPNDPTNPNKVLAAELLRGVGGILLNESGHRFCNELGKRDYVTDRMLEHNLGYAKSHKWGSKDPIPSFFLVLSSAAAKEAKKHIDLYMRKGLVKKVLGVHKLANHLGLSSQERALVGSLQDYRVEADRQNDTFGKTVFPNVPISNLKEETFYVGTVTPVLHYCMGGIKIDSLCHVLMGDDQPIQGLYAAGEVTGGVHGNNRLGGNSLLECAVYGSIVGNEISIRDPIVPTFPTKATQRGDDGELSPLRIISVDELSEHAAPNDAWVAIHGKVYNLSHFAQLHPGGSDSIVSLAGTDATDIFLSVHSENLLSRLTNYQVGELGAAPRQQETQRLSVKERSLRTITLEELQSHSNDSADCWVALHGLVYDLTEFSTNHPGGAFSIQKHAGKDATRTYQVFHPKAKLIAMQRAVVGRLVGDGQSSETI